MGRRNYAFWQSDEYFFFSQPWLTIRHMQYVFEGKTYIVDYVSYFLVSPRLKNIVRPFASIPFLPQRSLCFIANTPLVAVRFVAQRRSCRVALGAMEDRFVSLAVVRQQKPWTPEEGHEVRIRQESLLGERFGEEKVGEMFQGICEDGCFLWRTTRNVS